MLWERPSLTVGFESPLSLCLMAPAMQASRQPPTGERKMTRSKLAARKRERRALRRKTALRLVNLAIKRRTEELEKRLQHIAANDGPKSDNIFAQRVERLKLRLERLHDARANLLAKMGPQPVVVTDHPANDAAAIEFLEKEIEKLENSEAPTLYQPDE